MTKLILGLVGVVGAAGIAASLAIWHSTQARMRENAEASREQSAQIARLSAEHERLSNQVARGSSPQPLGPEQLGELLRLRGQVGVLRQAGREQAQLEATNAQLRALLAASEKQLAEARATPNFWAKDQLSFAGYADPEAAVKTLLWAMRNGDIKSYLASWASGENVNVMFDGQLGQATEAEIAAGSKLLTETLDPSVGFHILDKNVKSPDQVILSLSFDGEGRARNFVVQRTGSEWRVADMLRPGQAEP
jgi:hypothetical protein